MRHRFDTNHDHYQTGRRRPRLLGRRRRQDPIERRRRPGLRIALWIAVAIIVLAAASERTPANMPDVKADNRPATTAGQPSPSGQPDLAGSGRPDPATPSGHATPADSLSPTAADEDNASSCTTGGRS